MATGLIGSFKRLSRYLSLFVALGGVLVIAGWALDIRFLKSVLPGLVSMTPLTAVNFILIGTAVFILNTVAGRKTERFCAFLACVVWSVAFATLVEYCFRVNLGIDTLLFTRQVTEIRFFPGRMSPNAALCFLLASASVLLFSLYRSRTFSAYAYAFVQGIVALLALVGYAYGIEGLYGISMYKPMALHTAFSFLVLFFALILLRPETGPAKIAAANTEGGRSMRRLIPFVLVAPFLLGWMVVEGYHQHLYQISFGLSILTVLITIFFSGVVWENAFSLHITDLLKSRAERKAEEEKEFTVKLLRNSTAPTFVIDTHHRVLIWNNACEKLTGVPEAEVIGTSDHWKAFYDQPRPCLADILLDGECVRLCKYYSLYGKSTILPEGWHSEGWFDNLAGKRRYIVFDAAPVCGSEGEVIAVIETIQDITERVTAEESLHESEERYRELIQNLPVGLFRCTPGKDGRFIMANPAVARMFRYDSVLDLAGTTIEHLYADDGKTEQFARRFDAEGNIIGEEIRFRRRDGSFFWGAVTAKVVRSVAGNAMFYDGMIEDVTERKRIEEMKSDFVSMVSHQLKTPVAQIKGYVFNMLTGITGELNPKQREYLEDMQEVSDRNYRLISDLLNVSRIERGVVSVELAPLELRQVADAVMSDYYEAAKRKGLAFNAEGFDDQVLVMADREKLSEAVANAINNALKFTAAGSVTVRIRSDAAKGYLEVEDTGPGMTQETLAGLFHKDVAMAGAPTAGGGAGLGLFIGKNFMLLQKGDVTAESVVGRGTKFVFSVPLAQV